MNDKQYALELSKLRQKPIFTELIERLDKFSREERGKWKAGDLIVGGGVLLARSQGHDDIRAFLIEEPFKAPEEEPESTYRQPEQF